MRQRHGQLTSASGRARAERFVSKRDTSWASVGEWTLAITLSIQPMAGASKMPEWLEPMAATLTQERFSGPGWLFERKFDGIRLLAYKRGGDVRLYSRNRLEQHLPAVAAAVSALPVDEVILDGEVAWDGHSGYHVFDILWIDGRSVTSVRSKNAARC